MEAHTPNNKDKLSFRLLTHLMLLSAAFFWGLNPMVMKLGFQELNPLPFNTLRLFLGVVIAFPFLFIMRIWKPVHVKDIPRFFIIPTFGFFSFQFFYSVGVAASSAIAAAIILGTLPINVAIITSLFKIEHLSRVKIAGILATFAGVILIAVGKNNGLDFEGTYLWGILLLVVAEISYAAYTVSLKPLTSRYSTFQIVCIVMGVSMLLFALYSIPVHGIEVYRNLKPVTYLSAAFSGIFALILGNILWSIGVKRIGSTNTSVYGNLQPVFGVGAAILVLHESLSMLQLGGAFIVLIGVAIVNRRTGARRSPEGTQA